MSEADGVPDRYILFTSEYNWLATEEERNSSFNQVSFCIARAQEVGAPYSLIIDRHNPRVPIYLNPDNSYEPFEFY